MSELFSEVVSNKLHEFNSCVNSSQALYFPKVLRDADTKFCNNDKIQDWFRRVYDICTTNPMNFDYLESNLAIFAVLKFVKTGNSKVLSYANIQAIATECSLDDYYCGQHAEAEYLRLDLDTRSLGRMFTHPLAHLHIGGAANLRLGFELGATGNLLIDFLEYLYRTYYHEKWLSWAESVWNNNFQGEPKDNPWNQLVEAFKDSNMTFLRQQQAHLHQLKQLLQARKDKAFPHFMNTSDRQLLAYPT